MRTFIIPFPSPPPAAPARPLRSPRLPIMLRSANDARFIANIVYFSPKESPSAIVGIVGLCMRELELLVLVLTLTEIRHH